MQGGIHGLFEQVRDGMPTVLFMALTGLLMVVGVAWFLMPLFVFGIYRGIRRLARQAAEDRRRR